MVGLEIKFHPIKPFFKESSRKPKTSQETKTPQHEGRKNMKKGVEKKRIVRLVGAIDQGTTSSRVILFDPEDFYSPVSVVQHSHKQIKPKSGYVEHDPLEIIEKTKKCLVEAVKSLPKKEGVEYKIDSFGITNQRETTIVWDKETGKPLHNAVVWSDLRTEGLVQEICKKRGQNFLQEMTGLPVSTYFSGIKLRWLVENCEEVRACIKKGNCMFGTVDTWLIWNLTGRKHHVTDVTNASRTLMMNIKTLKWDKRVMGLLEIPDGVILPKIVSTAEYLGDIVDVDPCVNGFRLCGCIGDQQSAMVGQRCFEPGMAKATYGTGCFMLCNIGTTPVPSKNGLLTTVGYKFGKSDAVYAFEGAIPACGVAQDWLRDNLGFFSTFDELEDLVKSCDGDNGGVYFVPAFSGLFAPHWKSDVRGTIFGLTAFTKKQHVCRALYEAIAFQTLEVIIACENDSLKKLKLMNVDGGMTKDKTFDQCLADIISVPIIKPRCVELTAIGAAICSGIGSGLWKNEDELKGKGKGDLKFSPIMKKERREKIFEDWKHAIKMCQGWIRED